MDEPTRADEARRSPIARALITILRGYQRFVSPFLAPSCRFYPSCSAYAIEALREHGVVRGSGLTLLRLAKCAPWHPGGVDYVPVRTTARAGAPATEEQAPC